MQFNLSITIAEEEKNMVRRQLDRLTPTECAVLQGVLDCLSAKEIARQRGISPRTVEAHKTNILNKLGLRTTNEILRVLLALQNERPRDKAVGQ